MKKVITVILAGLILLGATACGKVENTAGVIEEKTIPVKVQKVETGEISVEYTYASRLKPEKQVSVIPEVSGKVLDIYFDIGDEVSEGDILFNIDEEAIRDNIKELEKQLEAVNLSIELQELDLASAKNGQYKQQLLQLEQQTKLAQIGYDSALKNYQDAKNLYEKGLSSEQQVDQLETALKQAEVSLQSAKESYDLYKNDLSPTNIEAKENQLKQTKIQKEQLLLNLENLNETLEKAQVKSPISGVIASRNIEEEQMITPQFVPFTIIHSENLIIEVGVSEKVANLVLPGDDVHIDIEGQDSLTGEIYAIAPYTDERTQTYLTKIRLNNEQGDIKPGVFAEVHFMVNKKNNAVIVPINSVLSDSNGKYAYVALEDQTAKKVTVETGIDNGTHIEITKGLSAGDMLIIEGQNYIQDNSKLLYTE